MPARRVSHRRRFAGWLADRHWVVPAAFVLGALALAMLMVRWDEADPLEPARSIDAASASTALAALGSGMLAFTGFVTSVVLVLVQFGTSEFSPRLVRWLRRNRTLNVALSTFVATFLFALVATVQVGRADGEFVPTRTLLAALGLTLLSVAMFLLLLDHAANGLRVANVAQRVDATARRVFDAVYPDLADPDDPEGLEGPAAPECPAAPEGPAAPAARDGPEGDVPAPGHRPPVQVVRQEGPGAVLVTFDHAALVRLARDGDAAVELVAAVGDHVPAGSCLLRVHGPAPLPERPLRRALVLGDERTLDDDPAFALRVLVDVAIRALSPAVNDPTTAVQMLHRIEDLLRYAAARRLTTGLVADAEGVTRLVYPTPTWDDLVELGLDEIRAFGAGSYQIARRLRALLDDLLADLPERRRPALLAQRALLDDAVARRFPEAQRPDALVADRQGLGMSRRPLSPR